MTHFKKNISVFFVLLIFMMLIKSMDNMLTVVNEIRNKPTKTNIEVCPAKNEEYFIRFKDGGYLFALYRYKSMGVKCKEQ